MFYCPWSYYRFQVILLCFFHSFKRIVHLIKIGNISLLLQGGQVFYGGAIGGIGALVGLKVTKADANAMTKIILPTIPLGHALGRIGCFLAGCCYGMPYYGPCSITFTYPAGNLPLHIPLFPVQLLEALINLLLFILLMKLSKKHSTIHIALVYIFYIQ
ncbi:MAG: prolipoprotein diacylglyceryl transferase [Clostridiales bacterium]|nr:prolipoprotein diacylglyceryl transferase [Clostridiales bacterium]